MASADPNIIFNQSVDRVFQGWTVFQLAIQHGFGGQYSREKGAWMVESVCNWFQDNAGIESYELEEFIGTLLDNEFETRAEDGSLQEVCQKICSNFALCRSGQASVVMEALRQLPTADMSRCVADTTEDAQDEDMDDSNAANEHNVHAMMNGMDIGSSSSTSQDTRSNSEGASSQQNLNSNDNQAAEDDGWTVVRKPKKK